jgi:serine/threonine protein kinase
MILLGLDFLHSNNIQHRDLKPENILLEKLNNGILIPIIGDFGVSKLDLEKMKETLRKTNAILTTPYYQAPEVINKKTATSKVDIWASGIVLYEMLT